MFAMKCHHCLFALAFLVSSWRIRNAAGQEDTCACAKEETSVTSGIVIGRCDPNDATTCALNCASVHSSDTYLADKCCIHAGKSASLLAFEEDSQWVPRLEEFNKCTGANVRLEYLPEGEDGMARALRTDVGDDVEHGDKGAGIFDAYIVQAPWLPDVVEGLENLTPRIREHADTIDFLDINSASRSAVSFNGTVRALPLDTDYVAIGWRQDVFHKNGLDLVPPKTIQELADLSELLNGQDHNGDGEQDWGVCLTPQVNYFYAFVAPIFQTQLHDFHTGAPTGQNLFFDADTSEPLIRVPGFRHALEQYWRIIRSSNCQGQLPLGQKCDRKSAFPTGRCAMVISMPGTLTSMLLDTGSRSPQDRFDGNGTLTWSVRDQPLGAGGTHWGRRAPFPGSRAVQQWDRRSQRTLLPCDSETCPTAEDDVNYAPFFAEGGEAYALNGRQSKPAARDVMWDVFAWMSELPVTKLPLSGQYRKSHLNEESRQDLINGGWPKQAADDLLQLLGSYFKSEEDGGNPAQDLLMLGFSAYMDALDEELHDKFLGVKVDSRGGLFDKTDPPRSIGHEEDVFDAAYQQFLDALEERYYLISKSMSGGNLAQLQRWRQSLNLPWKTDVELCSQAISIDVNSFRRLECALVVDMEKLCQKQPHDVAKLDPDLCLQYFGNSNTAIVSSAAVIAFLVVVIAVAFFYFRYQKNIGDSYWKVKACELHYADPPKIIGEGSYGIVVLANFRGTRVAVKKAKETHKDGPKRLTRMDGRALSLARSLHGQNLEMSLLSMLRHPAIATVMGCVVDAQTPALVMEYMELGSLYDVLHNETIVLDGDLVLPLLQEIAQGVRFLHSSDPQVIHGDLKAKNILVDSKFRAKVADFGLAKATGATGTPFWMPPELLRNESTNNVASDAYSFGMILYEVYSRKDPYEGESLEDVISQIIDPSVNKRPPVPLAAPKKMGELMRECLEPDPAARPIFEEIDLLLQRMSVENVEPGEMHLSVQARKDLKASRANALLYDVFPPHIAEALRDGRKVEQESHECVTIFFSDIVGFTTIVESSTPQKTCNMLDRLYRQFDELSIKHEIFKIETIGDAYMAITNLVKDQSSDHVKRCVQFAVDAIQAASKTLIDLEDPGKGYLQIRVGFHAGPVISDVVGSRLPKYGVFGDAVNMASRMESNSKSNRINCSEAAAKLLKQQWPAAKLTDRGPIPIKGKGHVRCFWVDAAGEESYAALPTFPRVTTSRPEQSPISRAPQCDSHSADLESNEFSI